MRRRLICVVIISFLATLGSVLGVLTTDTTFIMITIAIAIIANSDS